MWVRSSQSIFTLQLSYSRGAGFVCPCRYFPMGGLTLAIRHFAATGSFVHLGTVGFFDSVSYWETVVYARFILNSGNARRNGFVYFSGYDQRLRTRSGIRILSPKRTHSKLRVRSQAWVSLTHLDTNANAGSLSHCGTFTTQVHFAVTVQSTH